MERALLAVLVLEAGRVVPAGRIVDLLWGDDPPPKAVPALHTKVAHLRRALEPDRALAALPRTGLSTPTSRSGAGSRSDHDGGRT